MRGDAERVGNLDRPLTTLQWLHNGRDGVSNHWRLDCLLNRLFKRWSMETSKLRVTGYCEGNSPVTGKNPHKGPVTRKMFPFNDVVMEYTYVWNTLLVSYYCCQNSNVHNLYSNTMLCISMNALYIIAQWSLKLSRNFKNLQMKSLRKVNHSAQGLVS